MYCFEHIPKTGGLSIGSALNEYYGNNLYPLVKYGYNQIPEGIEVVHGHRARESMRSDTGVKFFTFARHPIPLVKSHFEHISRALTTKHFWRIRILRKSLDYYLENKLFKDFDNGMIRRIGMVDFPFGSCSKGLLENALEKLEKDYVFIGLLERFNESLFGLSQTLKWSRFPVYQKMNVGIHKIKLYGKDIDYKIAEINKFDIELYEYCKKRLENYITDNQVIYSTKYKEYLKQLDMFQTEKALCKPKIKLTSNFKNSILETLK